MAAENWKDLYKKTTLATQSRMNGFHTNPYKFRKFETVVKYFLKHDRARISF